MTNVIKFLSCLLIFVRILLCTSVIWKRNGKWEFSISRTAGNIDWTPTKPDNSIPTPLRLKRLTKKCRMRKVESFSITDTVSRIGTDCPIRGRLFPNHFHTNCKCRIMMTSSATDLSIALKCFYENLKFNFDPFARKSRNYCKNIFSTLYVYKGKTNKLL